MPECDIYRDLEYTITDKHSRQVLDLYIPQQPPISVSGHPLILYVHGGAFKFGSKESEFLPLRQLDHGYAIAAINYRLSGEEIFPAMLNDCKSALRFLKSPSTAQKYGLNVGKVIAWGESAGGHAVAMLGATSSTSRGWLDVGDYLDIPSSVNGVIDYYGPTNFLEMDNNLPEEFRTHNNVDSPESLYLGQQITLCPDRVRAADPCHYVSGMVNDFECSGRKVDIPEFLIAHGTADHTVPEYMSHLLVQALEAQSLRPEYIAVKDTGHCFTGIDQTQQKELDDRTDSFLRRVFGI